MWFVIGDICLFLWSTCFTSDHSTSLTTAVVMIPYTCFADSRDTWAASFFSNLNWDHSQIWDTTRAQRADTDELVLQHGAQDDSSYEHHTTLLPRTQTNTHTGTQSNIESKQPFASYSPMNNEYQTHEKGLNDWSSFPSLYHKSLLLKS